jgi:hypothetical protein
MLFLSELGFPRKCNQFHENSKSHFKIAMHNSNTIRKVNSKYDQALIGFINLQLELTHLATPPKCSKGFYMDNLWLVTNTLSNVTKTF